MRKLAEVWPVAVITDSPVHDATDRLRFKPHYLVRHVAHPGIHRGPGVTRPTAGRALDKGDTLLQTMRECGAVRALVVGDDASDEPAFLKTPWDSVSVRICPAAANTRARYRLASQDELDPLLNLLIDFRGC